MTKEHAWPKWLANVFPEGEPGRTFHISNYGEAREWVHGSDDTGVRVKQICASCNNGWMSKLETDVQPSLTKLMIGVEQFELTSADQAKLAKWSLKTFLVFDLAKPMERAFFSASDRRTTMNTGKPRVHLNLFIAPYIGKFKLFADNEKHDHEMQYNMNQKEARPAVIYSASLILGRVAIQLTAGRIVDDLGRDMVMYSETKWDQSTVQITPIGGPITWPPPEALSDESFPAWQRRLFDGMEKVWRLRGTLPSASNTTG